MFLQFWVSCFLAHNWDITHNLREIEEKISN